VAPRLNTHSPSAAQIIKLSDAVQPLPREATQYVHGAPGCFLEVGDEASEPEPDGKPRFSKGAYTLGKMVWGKVRQHEEQGRIDCRARVPRATATRPASWAR